ncbi:7513_t:CDS:2 [Acaulospora morrowiae]|uniref:7513_t:CDS:1 n=1 Tax=Acaulospora morrowiae TaxID=94023 RepID=A0A9N9CDV7_9GLOM|nr:7513_t:CDS:2 [Acaulospora morrowiae]
MSAKILLHYKGCDDKGKRNNGNLLLLLIAYFEDRETGRLFMERRAKGKVVIEIRPFIPDSYQITLVFLFGQSNKLFQSSKTQDLIKSTKAFLHNTQCYTSIMLMLPLAMVQTNIELRATSVLYQRVYTTVELANMI